MAGRSYAAPPSGPSSKSPPFLLRSRSGASRLNHSTSALDNPLASPNVNNISTAPALRRAVSAARSRSTTKTRADHTPPPLQRSQQRDSKENRDNPNSITASGRQQKPAAGGPLRSAEATPTKQRKPRSSGFTTVPASPAAGPSAWARSPGRSPAPAETPENGDRVKKKPGVRGVLSFFRQKKAPSPREETAHQLRVLYCRHLQWRFVNARAEEAARACKANSEKKLFNVWVRMRKLRKVVAAKRVLVQWVRHQTKLAAVVGPQLRLLQEWNERAGSKKNVEAMVNCGELLQAACTAVPVREGARADVAALQASISTAMGIMEGIESTIPRIHPKYVSDTNSLLVELVKTLKLEKEGLKELAEVAGRVASLQMQEMSLRAHLVQTTREQGLMYSKTHQNKLPLEEAAMGRWASVPVAA